MADDPTMPEFNWIKAREACSVAKMFLSLRQEVEQDVKDAQALFRGSGRVFDFSKKGESFSVFEQGATRSMRIVTFSMDETRTHIIVEQENGNGQADTMFTVALTLNKDKQCRFLLGDDELENWQLRRKALERLFFSVPVMTATGFQGV